MLLVFLLYLLFSLRVTVRLSVHASGWQNALYAAVGALGLWLRFDGAIALEEKKPRVRPRYGKRKRPGRSFRRRMGVYRSAKPWLRAMLPELDVEKIEVRARIGLDEAHETAVAAGAIHAAVSALAAGLGIAPKLDMRIQADFERPAFQASARCIFSFRLGDIMFAAVRFALRKTRREGFKWISIPLRA